MDYYQTNNLDDIPIVDDITELIKVTDDIILETNKILKKDKIDLLNIDKYNSYISYKIKFKK